MFIYCFSMFFFSVRQKRWNPVGFQEGPRQDGSKKLESQQLGDQGLDLSTATIGKLKVYAIYKPYLQDPRYSLQNLLIIGENVSGKL